MEPVRNVAVIIAAFHAEDTIARAIGSALAEPETAEVIVIDDASTDNTVATALAADDGSGRLKVLTQPRNAGPSAARNRAIRESAAPWIGILDADDFFLPGRLDGLLRRAEGADLIADDLWQVDSAAIDGPRRLLLGDSLPLPRRVGFAEFVESNVTKRNRARAELGFIKPLMRRDFLARHNLAYSEPMRLGEDYELYARALAAGARLVLVPAQGYVSVIRLHSLSGRHTVDDLCQLRDRSAALSRLAGLKPADRAALRRHYLSVDARLQWRLMIDAVKQRSLRAALATLLRPYPVPLHVLGQLLNQVIERGARRLAG